MLVFNSPYYFLFIAIIPLIVIFKHGRKRNRAALLFSHSVWKGSKFRSRLTSVALLSFISNSFLYLGIISIIISLAGPAMAYRDSNYLSRGVDIMIVLDESISMSAKDFPPVNRFESAKSIIKKFVEGRENDSVGIVSFADDAALRVPLTLDYNTIYKSVDDLTVMSLGNGTAIGMGLAVSTLHLKSSSAKSKVIILLTDGVNNAGEIQPLSAARGAKDLGIKVYAIGIGGTDEVDVEFFNPETGKVVEARMNVGGYNEEDLIEIAKITGGQFYRASSPGMLETVFQGIDYLETSNNIMETKIKSEPIYELFIIIGFSLLIGYYLIRKGILGEIL